MAEVLTFSAHDGGASCVVDCHVIAYSRYVLNDHPVIELSLSSGQTLIVADTPINLEHAREALRATRDNTQFHAFARILRDVILTTHG